MRCLILLFSFIFINLLSCSSGNSDKENKGLSTDTIKVATLYGPTSYFEYRGEIMGFDYENIESFSHSSGIPIKIRIASSLSEMLELLEKDSIDLIAYPVPYIFEYENIVDYCGPVETSSQFLVQVRSDSTIRDVTELIGKCIFVEKDSKFDFRLQNLNKELGEGIEIKYIEKDSLIIDDLIELVNEGEIPMTIIDSEDVLLNRPYYPKLDMNLQVSLVQKASWAVKKGNKILLDAIDNWENEINDSGLLKTIYKKYFEESKTDEFLLPPDLSKLKLHKGKPVSSYDSYFRKVGKDKGIDWLLLASIGYNESRFNPESISRFGATGLMQIMPSTAKAHGTNPAELYDSYVNINTAAKIIKNIDNLLSKEVEDSTERVKFVVAAYNSGLGHLYDAMALASKYGLKPDKWYGNVREMALLKSRPEYYNDRVVKHGYFRGRETVDFVDNVLGVYEIFKETTE